MPKSDVSSPAWVAADWGSSNLRLWIMSKEDEVLEAISDKRGAASLSTAAEFAAVLEERLAPYLAAAGASPLPVVACGMVGARQGWVEAPYISLPAPPVDGRRAIAVPDAPHGLSVTILPGMKQVDPADVMRGEETQIGGVLADDPGFEGMICLPGTHSKWVRVAEGKAQSFSTFMTGELFALLAGKSVLRHSVAEGAWDWATFDAASAEAAGNPERLTGALFGIRAISLLEDAGPDICTARLSGLLIGTEVGALRDLWRGTPVAVLGAKGISDNYTRVLRAAGATVTQIDATEATLRGLVAAYHQMKDQAK